MSGDFTCCIAMMVAVVVFAAWITYGLDVWLRSWWQKEFKPPQP